MECGGAAVERSHRFGCAGAVRAGTAKAASTRRAAVQIDANTAHRRAANSASPYMPNALRSSALIWVSMRHEVLQYEGCCVDTAPRIRINERKSDDAGDSNYSDLNALGSMP